MGSLTFNRQREYQGRILKASALAAPMDPSVRKPRREGDKTQWYFTCTLRLPDVKPKVRSVILWQPQHDASPRLLLVTNRVCWEVSRVVRV